MSTAIRPISSSDRVEWARLFADYGVFYETSFGETVLSGVWRWLMDETHEVSALVAADDDGALVGFAHYRRLCDTFTAATSWNLDDLYVSPAARGEGVATALIEAVADAGSAGGGGTLRWITAASNETAQRVYDRVATRAAWVTYERELD
jgi:GNAT superfamily N-acetyltransferase